MSATVGFTFLLLTSICNSFQLPAECNSVRLKPINNIIPNTSMPTANPSTDPTYNPTQPPTTPSPTQPWDIACCQAIKNKYIYSAGDTNSTCGALHGFSDSCTLTQTTAKIETLNLRNCSLTGTIPLRFRDMNDLRTLDMSHNTLSGTIPSYFNSYNLFSKLQRFYIANNFFIGAVPFNLFQYIQLKYIDFQQNKQLTLNITHLNLTDSSALSDKPAIAANFSFLKIYVRNDTDANFYTLFEKVRFSKFSMRSSINNFSFIWRNRKDEHSFHTIYATQTFDVFGNNISGEFPCNFKSVPLDLYVANNHISNTNITCYQSKQFDNLMIFQKERAYINQTKCYPDFGGWATSNDHNKYCMFIKSERSPTALKECCTNIPPPPTKQPTQEPEGEGVATTANWLLDNIDWFLLLLIFSFAIIICIIWKQKGKVTKKKEKRVPRQPKLSCTNDRESLLYGDF